MMSIRLFYNLFLIRAPRVGPLLPPRLLGDARVEGGRAAVRREEATEGNLRRELALSDLAGPVSLLPVRHRAHGLR